MVASWDSDVQDGTRLSEGTKERHAIEAAAHQAAREAAR
jgi:hypothetical protein